MKRKMPVVVVVAMLLLFGSVYLVTDPTPPNVEEDGYTSATFDFQDYDDTLPATRASTSDATVIRDIARVIAKGQPVGDCRCMSLGTVMFARDDDPQFGFRVMPAHNDGEVRLQIGGDRFAVDRADFLAAVESLGLQAARWTGE